MRRRRVAKMRRLCCERCEPRHCLSAVTFELHDLFCCSTWGNTDIDLADMDGDGDVDVVGASAWTEAIIWFENTDGRGLFGRPRLVATAEDRFVAIQAVDMDGDGDHDDRIKSTLNDSR